MSNGPAEWALGRSGLVYVNTLIIIGAGGKLIDSLPIDLKPVVAV